MDLFAFQILMPASYVTHASVTSLCVARWLAEECQLMNIFEHDRFARKTWESFSGSAVKFLLVLHHTWLGVVHTWRHTQTGGMGFRLVWQYVTYGGGVGRVKSCDVTQVSVLPINHRTLATGCMCSLCWTIELDYRMSQSLGQLPCSLWQWCKWII